MIKLDREHSCWTAPVQDGRDWRKSHILRGIASVLPAAAAGFGRFDFGDLRDARFGLGLRLRVGLATATSGWFPRGCILCLRS
jgi:hypothetical protein